jgi:hypothetical protein
MNYIMNSDFNHLLHRVLHFVVMMVQQQLQLDDIMK